MPALRAFLDRPGAAGAEAWKTLAADSSYEDYVSVARTLEVDQAFWCGLFAGGAARHGTALVLESRLGALSARLSSCFGTVLSWHVSAAAAAATRRRLDDLGIGNVRVVVAQRPADLELAGERLDAVVFYGIGADLTRQWGDDPAPRLQALMREIPAWLAPEGIVVIGENNKYVRRRHAGPTGGGRGLALPGLRHRLRRRFAQADLYVCDAPLTPGHTPPPDFVRNDALRAGSMLPRGPVAAIRSRLLNSAPARMLWPSFLLVASNRSPRGVLHEILQRPELAPGLAAQDGMVVKRVVAGHSGTSVIIAGPADHERANVVVRLPSQPGAVACCRNNARALKRLAQTVASERVPRLLGEGRWRGQEYTVESACPGFESDYGDPALEVMARQGVDLLYALHRQTGRRVRVTEEEFERLVSPCIRDIAAHVAPELRQRIDRLAQALRTAMMGRDVFLGYTHGDFKLGNVLFDRSGQLAAVIDWDGFSESGLQLLDYLTLLIYKMAYQHDRGFVDIYLEYLLPWKLPPRDAGLVEQALPGLTADADSFLLVRVVFWFTLLSARFDPLYKHHAEWQRRYLLSVLPALEKISQSGWRLS